MLPSHPQRALRARFQTAVYLWAKSENATEPGAEGQIEGEDFQREA
jgi:hypothetical protein